MTCKSQSGVVALANACTEFSLRDDPAVKAAYLGGGN